MNRLALYLCMLAAAQAGCANPGGAPEVGDATAGRTPSRLVLELGDSRDGRLDVLRDDFGLLGDASGAFRLPPLMAAYVSDGHELLPEQRLPVATAGAYDVLLLPGRTWHDPAGNPVRLAAPFALLEKNANCLHYGVIRFESGSERPSGTAHYRIAGETCQYLKFDASGRLPAKLVDAEAYPADAVVRARARERRARLPRRPIDALADDYPGARPEAFGNPGEVDPGDMSAFGFVIDGVHYAGPCPTRESVFPFCEELPLPSYSLAKSLVAGLALMRAERLWPGSRHLRVADLVPTCEAADGWDEITLEQLLDMASGRYVDTGYQADEDSLLASDFFLAPEHATKLAFACRHWPRREAPGQRFVYHTTDTYVLGAALAALARQELGDAADFYEELVAGPVFDALGLSPLTGFTQRTQDEHRQPFGGWGLVLLADDIARLAVFLGPDEGRIDGEAVVDPAMLRAALRRDGEAMALSTGVPGLTYDNGFWAYDAGPALGCAGPLPIPVMTGYGGIVVALFPNGSGYYYVSDGGAHRWLMAARAAHDIRPMCATGTEKDSR